MKLHILLRFNFAAFLLPISGAHAFGIEHRSSIKRQGDYSTPSSSHSLHRRSRNSCSAAVGSTRENFTPVSSTHAETTDSLPPVPKGDGNPADDGYRRFRAKVPLKIQAWIRCSGFGRLLSNGIVWFGVPAVFQQQPQALLDFFRVTQGDDSWLTQMARSMTKNSSTATDSISVNKIVYGDQDRRQFASLIQREEKGREAENSEKEDRVIVFVHGGAWGSGFPRMYSLVALPFLNAGYSDIAILGYRTYPSSDIDGQIQDLVQGLAKLDEKLLQTSTSSRAKKYTIIAHSSGAHICAMAFLQDRFLQLDMAGATALKDRIDQFIGLGGVYDIYHHYRFEQGRGVERLSAMAAAAGFTYRNFCKNSPTRLAASLSSSSPSGSKWLFPTQSILYHGAKDDTVPYTSSMGLSEKSGVKWELLDGTGHAEMVLELMFGGTTQTVILEFLESQSGSTASPRMKG